MGKLLMFVGRVAAVTLLVQLSCLKRLGFVSMHSMICINNHSHFGEYENPEGLRVTSSHNASKAAASEELTG